MKKRDITCFPIRNLRPNSRNARTHPKKQIKQIVNSIRRFGWTYPILADENGVILAGHGRYLAALELGLPKVPVITVADLSETEKRALALADNKIALNAGWDRKLLAQELGELADLLPECNLDLEITGFEPAEIDGLLGDLVDPELDPAERCSPAPKNRSNESRRSLGARAGGSGDVLAYVAGLLVERQWGSYPSLIVFLAIYFVTLWVAWFIAVRLTKPKETAAWLHDGLRGARSAGRVTEGWQCDRLASSGNMPRKANRWADDSSQLPDIFAGTTKRERVSPHRFNHRPFARRVCVGSRGSPMRPRERTCRRGTSSMAMFGSSTTIRGRTIAMPAASRGGGFTPAGLSLAAHRPMVGPTNDIKIYLRYFFRHGRWQPTARITKGRTGVTPDDQHPRRPLRS